MLGQKKNLQVEWNCWICLRKRKIKIAKIDVIDCIVAKETVLFKTFNWNFFVRICIFCQCLLCIVRIWWNKRFMKRTKSLASGSKCWCWQETIAVEIVFVYFKIKPICGTQKEPVALPHAPDQDQQWSKKYLPSHFWNFDFPMFCPESQMSMPTNTSVCVPNRLRLYFQSQTTNIHSALILSYLSNKKNY